MMRKNQPVIAIFVIVLMMTLVLAGCTSKTTDNTADEAGGEVLLGYVGPMTGPSATMGLATKQGAELAIEEINNAGGIMGKTIKFVSRDDEADPTKSKTAVQELIDKEKVQMMIGQPNSTSVAASEAYVNENKIIQILNIATNTQLTNVEKYPYTFRTFFPSPVQAEALVNIAKEADFQRAVLLGDTTALGNDGIAALQAASKAAGIKPVEAIQYKSGDVDMTPVAEKIKDAGADVVLAWTLGADGARIVSALSRIDYMDNVIFLGYTGLSLPNFRELAGDGISRSYMLGGYWSVEKGETQLDEARQKLYDKIVEKYDKYGPGGRSTSPMMVASGYDAVYLYKWAVETASSFDPDLVKNTLETKISEYPLKIGVANTYRFSPTNHEAISGKDLLPVLLDPMVSSDKIFGDVSIRGSFTK
ncbi:ABC transporter substrate-binding protein [Metallumcola ferriviriculae]|uniref:ABC transporter substrate-binding protein n=1 Tax=Metallumcola ferriviriculae TaxID=3039180 RepID=A0AAU0UMF3_9FIRM|nr:ABC transporter substrate-binding protein [Desulfitibacteraceae bacterium MK1]